METPNNQAKTGTPGRGDPAFESAMDEFAGISKPLTYVPEPTAEQAAAASVAQDKKAQLQGSFNSALAETNPQREAEVRALATQTGLPAAAIRQNLDEVKRQHAARQFEQQDMLKRFPHTAAFMSYGDNTPLVMDDYQNLQAFESLLAPTKGGPSGGVLPNIGRQLLTTIPRINQGLYQIGADVMGAGDQFIGQPFQNVTGLELFFSHAQKWMQEKRDQTTALADGVLAPVQGAGRIEGALMNATQSVATQLPGIAATVATRNPAYALGWAGTATGVQAYDQSRAQGLSPLRAAVYGSEQGITEALFERLPLHKLLGDLKVGSSLGRTIFHQLLTEIPSEMATTTVQNFNEWANLNPDKPFSTYLAQLPSDLVDTVLATTLSVGFQTTAAHTMNRYMHGQTAADKSNEQVAFLTKINDLANATQLRQRDPKSFEQFVATASEDGDVKDVFIDGKTLAQSGVDISALDDDIKKQALEAIETGGTVRIPVEQYAARLAGAEGSDVLLQHLKLSPNAMSKAEADVYMQEEGETLKAEINNVLATRQADQTFMDSKAKVETAVLDQLNTANRFTPGVNQSYAMLASSFYAVQASRLNITPEQMYARYPLRVQSNLASGIALSQDTTSPAFQNWFRESKAVDTGGKPLVLYRGDRPNKESFDGKDDKTSRIQGNVFFSNHADIARGYTPGRWNKNTMKRAKELTPADGMYAAHLSIQNPLEVDANGANWDEVPLPKGVGKKGGTIQIDDLAELARKAGYDGLIVRNVTDQFGEGDQYVVFNPEQIKSTDNVGTFDPNNANIYHQEALKRDSLGFYSQLAKEVMAMNLPAWKPIPAKALTPEEKAEAGRLKQRLDDLGSRVKVLGGTLDHPDYAKLQAMRAEANRPVKDPTADIGWRSALSDEQLAELKALEERVVSETREREKVLLDAASAEAKPLAARLTELDAKDKASLGAASGKDIWAKVKSLPVKKEEIEWLGLEDYLTTKDKFTRGEVVDFINNNGVKVEETVADQEESDNADSLNFDEGETWDSDEAWNFDIDYHKETVEEQEGEEIETGIINDIIETDEDYIRKNFDGELEEGAALLGNEEVVAWVQANFADKIAEKKEDTIQERAEEAAKEAYRDNPVMIYRAETEEGDIYIFGNDDLGYSIRRDGWENQRNQVNDREIYSYSEAEVQANAWAREEGWLTSEDDETVAKWEDYKMNGQSRNYRELKLILPDVEDDFYNTVHFPDRNVLAFLRVDDRKLPLANATKEALKTANTRVPLEERMYGNHTIAINGGPEENTGETFGGWMELYNKLDASLKEREAAVKEVFDRVITKQGEVERTADMTDEGHAAFQKQADSRTKELQTGWAAGLGAGANKRFGALVNATENLPYGDPDREILHAYTVDVKDHMRLGDQLQNKINDYKDEATLKVVEGLRRMPDPVTVEGTFKPEFVIEQYPEDYKLAAGSAGWWYARITNGPKNTQYEDYRTKATPTREETEAFVAKAATGTQEIAYTQKVTPKWQVGETYFIDEFQSDWHQKGNAEGYQQSPAVVSELRAKEMAARDAYSAIREARNAEFTTRLTTGDLANFIVEAETVGGSKGWSIELGDAGYAARKGTPLEQAFAAGVYNTREEAVAQFAAQATGVDPETLNAKAIMLTAEQTLRDAQSEIPNAPFKDDGWIALGVKRAILDAVENGYDQIGWAGAQTVMSRWSSKYETAYTNQYDKKMPSLFKKLTGQEPVQLPQSSSENYWVVEITPELKAKVKAEGFSLFQKDQTVKRGAFTPTNSTITLLKDADLSTFLHEFGHFMLEVQTDMATRPDAPKQIREDMDALLKWYGIKGRSQGQRLVAWNAMTLEQKRASHEKFARGFEAYLLSGRAPAPALRPLFQRFRSWLVNIYKQLKNLNVSMTKDVTSVFDRMLATDAEIQQAEEAQRFEPLFKAAEEAGMTPEEFLNYQQLGRASTANAIETLDARNLRDMQWLSNARARGIKKLQAQAESQRRVVRAEMTAKVSEEPVYKAMQFFKRGIVDGQPVEGLTNFKMDAKAVRETMGEKRYAKLSGWFGKYGLVAEDGMHPDAAAEMFGFKSGDHLLKALVKAEPMQDKINGLTDQRMLEQYGELVDPAAIEQAVMSSLANDTRAKFVAAELTALNNALGGRKFWADAAKQYAETLVNRQRLRDLRPVQYEAAESKAAKEAQKAFAKADLELASAQKRNQLINLYAAKAARKAVDRVEKGLRYVKKFDKVKKGRPKIDADYRDQIDQLLEQYDLKPITNKAVDKRITLREWLAKQAETGVEPDLSEELINDARRRSYKELTVEQFDGLLEAIKQIEHVGRLKQKLLTAKKQQEFEKAKEEVLAAIEANKPKGRKPNLRTRTNAGGKAKELGLSYLAMHRKMASFLREMDGFKDGGPLWEYIVRPMNEAGDRETTMREKATLKLADISEKLLKNQEVMGGKGTYFDALGIALNREERISIALNLGNEGNAQRLLDGAGWSMKQLEPVLDTLTKEDWDFVQEVWDYFESYRPEIAAKERRVYGKEPEWVNPRPVVTKHGTYRGGYYPIRYDTRASGKSKQFMKAEEAKQMMRGAFNASTTRRSFTKARAEKVTGRPLLYSFNTIYQGTEEIIHDLTHHEWLIDATKFLRDPEFDRAVREAYGPEYVDLVQSAVVDIARGYQPAENVFETSMSHLRKGATVAGLGWNFSTAALQPLGLTNSMVRIGPGWVGRGISAWFKSPIDLVEEIYGKSEFMRLRGKTMQREINEIQNRLQTPGRVETAIGKVAGAHNVETAKDWVKWSMFLTIQKMQLVADIPTWQGAYEKAISEGNSDERAAALADQAVIDAQGGGQVKDLAEIQRGSQFQQLWTNFYSYFNVVYNLNAEVINRTDWKDPYEVAVAARDYLLLMVVPAILGKLLKDALTPGDDEDYDSSKKLAKALAAEQISYLMGTMVGLREMTAAVQRVAGVNQFVGSYGGPAGLRFFQETEKLATQLNQGNADRALRKSTINTVGVLFHLPSTQINRTWSGVEDLVEGKTSNPLAIITGGPR